MNEPEITIDDLTVPPLAPGQHVRSAQGSSPRWYHAKAVRENIQASIELMPARNERLGYYRMLRTAGRKDQSARGVIDKKQTALLDVLTERVRTALLEAGWMEENDMWRYSGSLTGENEPESPPKR